MLVCDTLYQINDIFVISKQKKLKNHQIIQHKIMNNNVPPSSKLNTLPMKDKQSLMLSILERQIQQQDYLNKMYHQDIQLLNKQKQSLEKQFQLWEQEGLELNRTWDNINQSNLSILHKNDKFGKISQKILKNSTIQFDQSLYFNQSPTKLSNFGKKKNDSPIRKLHSHKKSVSIISQSPEKYNKIKQMQEQISQLSLKMKQKQQKYAKQKAQRDEISQNLFKKIEEEENLLRAQIQRWKQLQKKQYIKKEMDQKIRKMKQALFRQKQSIKTIKTQVINRNRQIIKSGYTQKMLEVIAAYGGTRK